MQSDAGRGGGVIISDGNSGGGGGGDVGDGGSGWLELSRGIQTDNMGLLWSSRAGVVARAMG